MQPSRRYAGVLLAVAFAMVIETSCSHAPTPSTKSAEPEPRSLTNIYTADNTLYIASRYAVTDSFVVIQELVRDTKYYPYQYRSHYYNQSPKYRVPPANTDLPIMLPLKQVQSIGPWQESHETRNGVLAAVVIVAGLAAALAIVISQIELGGD